MPSMIVSIGTGGTIAGTGRYLKAMDRDIIVCLADPQGSGLYNKASKSQQTIRELLSTSGGRSNMV